MASTYVNDLRLNEMATGDQSGSWGTVTNTNLELIAEAFSYSAEAITTNADAHTTTIADGATDPGRSMFLKYTGTLDSACTITIGPNTVSKLWFIENATSGSQNIIIKQGSGATVTIASGKTKAIYSDGVGSGAKMVDAFAALDVGALSGTSATFDGGVDIDNINIDGTTIALSSGAMTISGADDITLDAVGDVILSCDGDQVKFDDGTTTRFTFNLDSTPTMGMGTLTLFENEIDVSSGNLTLDVAGDISLDADDGDIQFKNGGTLFGSINSDASSPQAMRIQAHVANGDIVFKGNDGGATITALSLDMSEAGAATFNSAITSGGNITVGGTNNLIVNDSGAAVFGNDGDLSIGNNGTIGLISAPNGDITLDTAGLINLDSSGSAKFKINGTTYASLANNSGNAQLFVEQADKDMLFKGNDGGTTITALTLDMSAAGAATFNGDVNAPNFNTTSDATLKTNVETLTGSLDAVKSLRGVSFDWLENGGSEVGVIAQEVEDVLPDVVNTNEDGIKSVKYGNMVAVLIEAMKEQQAQIDELKTQLNS